MEPLIAGEMHPHPTMKQCHGFIDLYKTSFCLPLWSDLSVWVDKIGSDGFRYQYADEFSSAVNHSSAQTNGRYPEDKFVHLKLIVPWSAREKTGVNFLLHSPYYNLDNFTDYSLPSGVVNFKFQHTINVNMLFNREKTEKVVTINYDTPMLFVTPMTENKVEIKNHLVSDLELRKIIKGAAKVKFFNSYKTVKQKSIEKESRCPFKW